MSPAQLPSTWKSAAADLRRFGAESQARTLEACAEELTAALRTHDEQLLSLRAAAAESGYSVDHLGRLLREGIIPNSGRKGKPLIRRRDLPVKAGEMREKSCIYGRKRYIGGRLFRDIIHSKFGGDDAQS